MDRLIEEALEALEGAGWTVERAPAPRPLPAPIARRYPHIPPLAAEFITRVERCERGDGGCWLLTAADYDRREGDEFGWDFFERMFTQAGPPIEGVRTPPLDPDDVAATRRFWDSHLPILPYVWGDYEYLAIGTDPAAADFGKVVHGYVIDFDSPGVEADSYPEFLARLSDVARREPTRSAAYDDYLTLFVHSRIIEDGTRPPWERKSWLARIGGWFGR